MYTCTYWATQTDLYTVMFVCLIRMNFKDWCCVYTHVAICRLINTSIFSFQKTWHEAKYYGHWDFASAGGCVNNKETFFKNPQVFTFVTSSVLRFILIATSLLFAFTGINSYHCLVSL